MYIQTYKCVIIYNDCNKINVLVAPGPCCYFEPTRNLYTNIYILTVNIICIRRKLMDEDN